VTTKDRQRLATMGIANLVWSNLFNAARVSGQDRSDAMAFAHKVSRKIEKLVKEELHG
jgi:hypothetical protein